MQSLKKEIEEKQDDRKGKKDKVKTVSGDLELVKLSHDIVSSKLA